MTNPDLKRSTIFVKDTYIITVLVQVRLLSDPLKLRLLKAFAEAPKATKQVAKELGENVTKLYRHVDTLHDDGLLVVVEEKQKRGTVERTFRAVTQRFEADHALFSDEVGQDGSGAAREMLRISEGEMLDVLSTANADDEQQAIIMRIGAKPAPRKSQNCERRSTSGWIPYRAAMSRPVKMPKSSVG